LGNAILGDWPNNNPNVAVHYKIHKIRPEWQDEEKLKEWLYEQYEEKDKLLEKFYSTGSFGGKRQVVNFPISRSLFVEFFWLAISYLHYNTWFKPLFLLILSSCGL
jgi:lysophosphatidylglycerol acyltransferase 1